ncbi:MAG: chorismate mutase [Lachnospiraceae bacterium]|nr:chorismate mutase [Lachnospiraceae bacterium]
MDIQELRLELNQIDKELSALFARRMSISGQVAEYKRAHNMPVLDRSREREVIARAVEGKPEEYAGYIRLLYNNILDLSRAYQHVQLAPRSELKVAMERAIEEMPATMPTTASVACQGTEGAYSQICCDKLFHNADIMYTNSFEGVFQAVQNNLCRYGVLPIENNIYGSVNQVYDLMKKYKFYIARSMKLRIDHCLVAKPGVKTEDIREIYSHEQALGQCSEYLKGFPNAKKRVWENTAMAAKMVAASDDDTLAAICSMESAQIYGLHILDQSIQNNDNNYTRFICISKEMEVYQGANKISIMFSLSHKPGALYGLLASFAAQGLNVTKLESRPIPGRDFEFMFYADLEASIADEEVQRLICQIEAEQPMFAFLGAYSER